MKRSILTPLVVAAGITVASAWTPSFTAGIGLDTLKVDGKAICDDNDSLTFPSPTFADWDGDGLDDMILGYWKGYAIGVGLGGGGEGEIRFLKNVGTKGAPEFTDMGRLYADGSIIELEAA